jgi:hypothetical protein
MACAAGILQSKKIVWLYHIKEKATLSCPRSALSGTLP